MRLVPAVVAALATMSMGFAPGAAPAWPIDHAHSRVTFTVTKWGFVDVEGRFQDFSGEIAYDAGAPERSRVDWRVRVASVETGESNRDKTLLEPEYLDAARNPELRFVSRNVRRRAPDEMDVDGTITIRGVSKALTIPVHYGGRHDVPGEAVFEIFTADFTLNRYDFGVVGGSLLGPAISREVNVKLVAAARRPTG